MIGYAEAIWACAVVCCLLGGVINDNTYDWVIVALLVTLIGGLLI